MKLAKKCSEKKVLRDPIHGYIHIQYEVIWDLLHTREVQRLRRIHQLGGNYYVYHTAEHSRFSHSLGVYEIVNRMVHEVEDLRQTLSEKEKIVVMSAALLHDLGHGPFSHFYESLTKKRHEEVSVDILMDPHSQIHQVLISYDLDLPSEIGAILCHQHPVFILNQIISSQLDADRMDYLLRDAYETGTSYGTFDLERILRTLRVCEDRLCIKESGIHSVEDYIMARYHMYWQVYLHPDAKAFELLITKFYQRYAQVKDQLSMSSLKLLDASYDLNSFMKLDECRLFALFQDAQESGDPYLEDLATRILERRLFEWVEDPSVEQAKMIRIEIEKRQLPLDLYYHEEFSHSSMYLPYREKDEEDAIEVLNSQGSIDKLSAKSEIVKAFMKMETHTRRRVYYVKDKIRFDEI